MSTAEELTYINIGKNIRKHRMERGLSQEKLAEMIGASDKFIGHIERFERNVSLRKLIKIAQVLKIELKELFEF